MFDFMERNKELFFYHQFKPKQTNPTNKKKIDCDSFTCCKSDRAKGEELRVLPPSS